MPVEVTCLDLTRDALRRVDLCEEYSAGIAHVTAHPQLSSHSRRMIRRPLCFGTTDRRGTPVYTGVFQLLRVHVARACVGPCMIDSCPRNSVPIPGVSTLLFSLFQSPLISMRKEISARPQEAATPLLPEPSPPRGNRKGTLSFPNADTLVSQFVRVYRPTETVPCYFPLLVLFSSPHPKPSVEREEARPRQKTGHSRQGNINIFRNVLLLRRPSQRISNDACY